eukprot:5007633-Amphidinium_carterae.1
MGNPLEPHAAVFWTKPSEVYLTRLTNYIVIKVERTPPLLSSCACLNLKEQVKSMPAHKQIGVVGKPRSKGCFAVLSSVLHCWNLNWTMKKRIWFQQHLPTNKFLQRKVRKSEQVQRVRFLVYQTSTLSLAHPGLSSAVRCA